MLKTGTRFWRGEMSEGPVLTLILSGGKGERLYPLTKRRAKAAVPFGGKFKLIDIAVSNCLHSDFRQIYVLTQWSAAPLHHHVTQTYQLNAFEKEFIEILAAEQTFEHSEWYGGTADAVRKSFLHLNRHNPGYYLILSSDQLYRMNLRDFFNRHVELGADISIAGVPVSEDEVSAMGLMAVDSSGWVKNFVEKPKEEKTIHAMRIPQDHFDYSRAIARGKEYLASMGIYLFKAEALESLLESDFCDFGHEILPASLKRYRVASYMFHGFWKDVGTIPAYYRTSLSLAEIQPAFNFFDEEWPIYSNETDLPASKMNSCTTSQSLTADGCIITEARLQNSVIGPRVVIENGAFLDGVVCMGNEHYETDEQKRRNREIGIPSLGIGRGTLIRNTIIDENVRIGEYCRIGMEDIPREDRDTELYSIRSGIIVIPEGTVIPDRTVI